MRKRRQSPREDDAKWPRRSLRIAANGYDKLFANLTGRQRRRTNKRVNASRAELRPDGTVREVS